MLFKTLRWHLSTSESSNDIAMAIWLDLPNVDLDVQRLPRIATCTFRA